MSIGIAFSEHSFGKVESLYIEADKKMYAEKKKTKTASSALQKDDAG